MHRQGGKGTGGRVVVRVHDGRWQHTWPAAVGPLTGRSDVNGWLCYLSIRVHMPVSKMLLRGKEMAEGENFTWGCRDYSP